MNVVKKVSDTGLLSKLIRECVKNTA